MPDFQIGFGSVVRIGREVANTIAYTTLVGIQDVSLPESESDEIDVTHMSSPNRTKQTVPGLITNSDVSLDIIWEPGSVTDVCLSEIRASGEIVEIEFTVPGMAAPEVFKGWAKQYSRQAPVQDRMESTVIFKINEKVIA